MNTKKTKLISIMLAALFITLLQLPTITSNTNQPKTNPKDFFDFGDAPEGPGAIAYPSTMMIGSFPTCISCGPAPWIQHNNFGAFFGPTVDMEPEGNGGLCPTGSFPPYDQDECFMDADAGLLIPDPYTIDPSLNVIPCPTGMGMPLGVVGQTVTWGIEIDIDVTNFMPSATIGFVNVLMDWNQNGMWGDPGEHVLINFPVPNTFTGPLSMLGPPPFSIGPNSGYVWTRFSITEIPVTPSWMGEGFFEDGETEDYLLKIGPINNPPTASFTYAPPNPTDLDLITFTDTSSDTDGTLVNWSWDFGDGNSSYQRNPTHQYLDDDTYSVTLTVRDDGGATDATTTDIPVDNVPPNAVAGGPYNAEAGTPITLDGSTSDDSDGTIVLYEWDLDNDGFYDDATGATTIKTWSSAGTYTIGLKVTDDDGATDTDTTTVDVTSNAPPTASFSYSPLNPTDLDTIQFTDSSTDTDGTLENWSWDFGDGNTSYQQNPSHQYADDDTYTVTLTVEDDEGATDTTTKTVPVSNVAPTADAGGPYTAGIGETITLDGSSSSDPDGTIVLFEWDLDDDGAYDDATGTTTTNSWSSAGTHTIGLKITDDDGATDTDTATVTVGTQNHPPQTPTITGPTQGKYGTEYTFNFTATDPDSNDISFTIDWGDDDTEQTITVSSGQTLQISHTWEKENRESETIDTAYLLKAKAVDDHDAESDWGTLEVSMPLTPTNPLQTFLNNLINWLTSNIPAFSWLIGLANT